MKIDKYTISNVLLMIIVPTYLFLLTITSNLYILIPISLIMYILTFYLNSKFGRNVFNMFLSAFVIMLGVMSVAKIIDGIPAIGVIFFSIILSAITFMIFLAWNDLYMNNGSLFQSNDEDEDTSNEDEVIIIKSNECVDECTEIPVDLVKAIERYKSAIEGMSDEEVMSHFPWFSSVGYSLIEDITSNKSEAIDRKTFGYLRIADKLNEELNNHNDKLTSELEDIINTI